MITGEEQRELTRITFCVAGLSFMMMGLFVIAGRFNISVVLGTIVGSLSSMLNYSLYVITLNVSRKCDAKRAALALVLSRVFRILLVSMVAFIIFMIPMLNDITGIIALFFARISCAAIAIIKS